MRKCRHIKRGNVANKTVCTVQKQLANCTEGQDKSTYCVQVLMTSLSACTITLFYLGYLIALAQSVNPSMLYTSTLTHRHESALNPGYIADALAAQTPVS